MYENLISAINSRLPDNTAGRITPQDMRSNFADLINTLGLNSGFLGYAPLSNPTPTPDGKAWYITDPSLSAQSAKTYTNYGNTFTVRVGMQYIVWWNGTAWNWTIVERDFQNANYGSIGIAQRGGTRIDIPTSPYTPTPATPRIVSLLSDASDTSRVVRMLVDNVETTPSDYVEFADDDAHTVALYLDASYGASTPACFGGVDAQRIALPSGVTAYDQPVGTTATEVVLPQTVTRIDAAAITATSAQRITLTGAPPTLDASTDWSYIQTLTIPSQYSMLYGGNPDWQAAVAAVKAAGGSVVTSDSTAYNPDTYIPTDLVGTPGGIAQLDTNGLVPSSQLPTDLLHDPRFQWRTPTSAEWAYIFNTRPASTVSGTANARYVKCRIQHNDTWFWGVLIFPDAFVLPSGIDSIANINQSNSQYNAVSFSNSLYTALLDAGCIFLPTGGLRLGTTVSNYGTYGYYWLSDLNNSALPMRMYFRAGALSFGASNYYQYGMSVRCIATAPDGAFSTSASSKCNIAPGNLQYHCKDNRWRFAPNQNDTVGEDNAYMSPDYDGWIDLFGYGASGWYSGAAAYQPYSTSTTESDYISHDLKDAYARADWGMYASRGDANDVEAMSVTVTESNGTYTVTNPTHTPAQVAALIQSGKTVIANVINSDGTRSQMLGTADSGGVLFSVTLVSPLGGYVGIILYGDISNGTWAYMTDSTLNTVEDKTETHFVTDSQYNDLKNNSDLVRGDFYVIDNNKVAVALTTSSELFLT